MILVDNVVKKGGFAEEVAEDSDPETANNLERAVVSQKEQTSKAKFASEVKTGPTLAAAGLGLVVTKQVKSKATFPVKGVWFDSPELLHKPAVLAAAPWLTNSSFYKFFCFAIYIRCHSLRHSGDAKVTNLLCLHVWVPTCVQSVPAEVYRQASPRRRRRLFHGDD